MKKDLKQALETAFTLYDKRNITAEEIVSSIIDLIDHGEEYLQICNAVEMYVGHSLDMSFYNPPMHW